MIFSGMDLSILTTSSGSLPLLAALALVLMWWLDDELADAPSAPTAPTRTPSQPTPPTRATQAIIMTSEVP